MPHRYRSGEKHFPKKVSVIDFSSKICSTTIFDGEETLGIKDNASYFDTSIFNVIKHPFIALFFCDCPYLLPFLFLRRLMWRVLWSLGRDEWMEDKTGRFYWQMNAVSYWCVPSCIYKTYSWEREFSSNGRGSWDKIFTKFFWKKIWWSDIQNSSHLRVTSFQSLPLLVHQFVLQKNYSLGAVHKLRHFFRTIPDPYLPICHLVSSFDILPPSPYQMT